MNDRPSARELIDAVRHYLEAELLPSLTDARQRYQALIAANVLAVVRREMDADTAAEEVAALRDLLGENGDARALNKTLCERIRQGAFDSSDRFAAAAAVVRRLVVRKLEVANPKYLNAAARVSSG